MLYSKHLTKGAEDGSYILPFLAEGVYDLIIAGVNADGTYTVVDETFIDIIVTSENITTADIALTD